VHAHALETSLERGGAILKAPSPPPRFSASSASPRLAPGVGAALAAVLAILPSCTDASRPPNLLLISIDTLRADRLGCYGYGRPTTPFLDRQAERGVLFEDASATSSWTYPSHASLFTGLYPSRNGATQLKSRVRTEVTMLAEQLAARGYRVDGVVSSTLFLGYGLERGFEDLELVEPGGPEPSSVTTKAIEWLRASARERPFFLLVHYLDPHSDYSSLPEFEAPFREPYEGPATGRSEQLFQHVQGYLRFDADDARHLSNLYDAGVRQQDAELEKLFAYLAEAGLAEETVIVLTSDHGEEFLEHGGVMHGLAQYEESVRVPLLFFGPGVPAGVRVPTPVSLVDVLPTVLELLALPLPPDLDGLSLRPSWQAAGAPERALFVEADLDPPGPGARTMVPGDDLAVRRGRYKLVLDPTSENARLFDLVADPRETRDVAGDQAEIARALGEELKRFRARRAESLPTEPLDAADLEKLEALGYAGEER
jgi:arylsulfatase A-like enzyme